MYCPKCGSLLPDDANFCDNCGNRVGGELQNAADTPQSFDFTAQGSAGEAALGTLGAVESGAPAPEGPVRVVGSGFKSLFTSIGAAFKNPKKLIPAFILAGVWLTLNILRAFGIEPLPTRMLSFLTFANAGTSGGIAGAVGGIVGKGVFAYALVSLIGLFTRKGGEKRRFADTLKGAFGVTLGTLFPRFGWLLAGLMVLCAAAICCAPPAGAPRFRPAHLQHPGPGGSGAGTTGQAVLDQDPVPPKRHHRGLPGLRLHGLLPLRQQGLLLLRRQHLTGGHPRRPGLRRAAAPPPQLQRRGGRQHHGLHQPPH